MKKADVVSAMNGSNNEDYITPYTLRVTLLNKIYPVGAIFISTSNTNPSEFLGGKWEAFGSGRTLVGVDTSQTEFNSVEKTGGSKTHTLTVNQMPKHSHTGRIAVNQSVTGPTRYWFNPGGTTGAEITNSNVYSSSIGTLDTGGSKPHNNLQPYITVYMFKRVS